MINKTTVFLLFLFVYFLSHSQEKETVVIKKSNFTLYQGVLMETKTWFLLVDTENKYYLAKIDRPVSEVYDWFMRFKDSQNIYKATPNLNSPGGYIGKNQYSTLHFRKENEPGDILNFYLEKPDKETLVLISLDDSSVFSFKIVQ